MCHWLTIARALLAVVAVNQHARGTNREGKDMTSGAHREASERTRTRSPENFPGSHATEHDMWAYMSTRELLKI